MHTLRLYNFIFATFITLILTGCVGGKDTGMPCQTSLQEEFIGNVTIDSSFTIWMRPNSSQRKFINSHSGIFSLSVAEEIGGMYDDRLEYIWATEPCQNDRVLTTKVEYDEIMYTSEELPFAIRVRRELSLDYNEFLKYQDTLSKKSEQIDFYVGWEGTRFYLKDTNEVYFDEYVLLDSVYKQVYVCASTTAKQGLYPTKFILQKGIGLIGFELSNKEVWAAIK